MDLVSENQTEILGITIPCSSPKLSDTIHILLRFIPQCGIQNNIYNTLVTTQMEEYSKKEQ